MLAARGCCEHMLRYKEDSQEDVKQACRRERYAVLEKVALLCSGCVPLASCDVSLRGNLNCEQFGIFWNDWINLRHLFNHFWVFSLYRS